MVQGWGQHCRYTAVTLNICKSELLIFLLTLQSGKGTSHSSRNLELPYDFSLNNHIRSYCIHPSQVLLIFFCSNERGNNSSPDRQPRTSLVLFIPLTLTFLPSQLNHFQNCLNAFRTESYSNANSPLQSLLPSSPSHSRVYSVNCPGVPACPRQSGLRALLCGLLCLEGLLLQAGELILGSSGTSSEAVSYILYLPAQAITCSTLFLEQAAIVICVTHHCYLSPPSDCDFLEERRNCVLLISLICTGFSACHIVNSE